ncbi:MAG: hypothetical protein HYZ42_06125 [Bacteroidetes bacterium]|nr:hypothetical protein [Bacteroidota bacterium]
MNKRDLEILEKFANTLTKAIVELKKPTKSGIDKKFSKSNIKKRKEKK